MKRCMQSTTYLVGPILMFLALYLSMFTNIVNVMNHLHTKLNAYAICSEKMMDFAFVGKVLDFKTCYLKELENTTPINCYLSDNKVLCEYNNTVIEYSIPGVQVKEKAR